MKIFSRLVLLAVAVALGFGVWAVLFPSPEKAVLKKISGLATTATISASDGNLTRAAKVSNLISYFTPDAEISFEVTDYHARTLSGREEIREAAVAGFTGLTSLKVQFLDATARIAAYQLTADVSCTARVTAGNSKEFGVQELHIQLKKIAGDWLIARVETVKTLS